MKLLTWPRNDVSSILSYPHAQESRYFWNRSFFTRIGVLYTRNQWICSPESYLQGFVFPIPDKKYADSEMSGFLWIGPQSSKWWQTRDTQLIKTAWNLSISKSASSPIACSRLSEDIEKWTGYAFISSLSWENTEKSYILIWVNFAFR